MTYTPRPVGRPREEGSGRSLRRAREEAQALQAEAPRRKKIRRLATNLTARIEADISVRYGSFTDAQRKTLHAHVVHTLRHLLPVEPAVDAIRALAGGEPTAAEVTDDLVPPGYTPVKLSAAVYAIYEAAFNLIHGLDDLSGGAMTSQATLDSYEIRRL